ncbi:CPBP family glutamic-type intramembrane protease [Streptomyces venezuelae]|uniref:CPBP family glutamic-type intramembrane protease n=1 Tax=Streptomyces venezuelae TaxID=54571 RepID=UPI00341E7874
MWNLNAALGEETMLLALPVAVMTRRGLTWPAQLTVLILLRLPFHLYYGLGATVMVSVRMTSWLFVYQRTGSLWPLMLAHFTLNSLQTTCAFLPPGTGPLLGATALTLAAVTAFWWARQKP